MYIEYPYNQNKDLVKDKIDKYISKLNKLEFYSNFKIADIIKSWNDYEMSLSLMLKQGILERRIKGIIKIKDEIIIIEFELPDVVKNFIKEEKLKSIILKHLDNVVNEASYVE